MEFFLIAVVAFGVAILTFFSGFGLGTILMPVFAIFFPIEIAIALTAVVHLANNIFKLFLIGRSVNKKIFLLFALPAFVAAFLGAVALNLISREIILFSYTLAGSEYDITLLRLVIAVLLIVFAILELNPGQNKYSLIKNSHLAAGGALAGFFGGLSGHQGALRSMFLLRAGLGKEGFVATGIAASTLIDVSRITVYGSSFLSEYLTVIDKSSLMLLLTAIIAAFAGSLTGRIVLKKITMDLVRNIVGYLILVLAILLGAGII
jgi:uncharacterized protein